MCGLQIKLMMYLSWLIAQSSASTQLVLNVISKRISKPTIDKSLLLLIPLRDAVSVSMNAQIANTKFVKPTTFHDSEERTEHLDHADGLDQAVRLEDSLAEVAVLGAAECLAEVEVDRAGDFNSLNHP